MAEGKLTIRGRVMQAVSDLVYRFHWLVLVAIVLISVFMYFSYKHLELKLNFTDMLSPDDPAVLQYRHAVNEFGALSFLFVIVESDDLDQSKAYADELAKRLVKNPAFVPRVFYKVEIKNYLDDGLLFLPPRDLTMIADLTEKNRDNLAGMVQDPGLTGAVTGMDRMLKSYVEKGELPEFSEKDVDFNLVFDPMRDLVKGFKDYALNGPGKQQEKLKAELFSRLLKSGQDLPIDLSEPYLVSADKKHLLMLVSSTQPAENFEWCRQFMEYVESVFAGMKQQYPGIKVQTTGNAAVMRDDNRVIRHDMATITIVAYIGIMLLFAFSFRNISSIVMVGVPLAVGILWSLGAAYWAVGHLTPITAVFGAILLGMGIDYGILILSRYTEERHAGHTIKEALDISMVQAGSSIIAGAFATSLAFFSLTQAQFKGGQEMGIISGIGIIIFVIIMTFGLGSLLVAWDRTRKTTGPTQRRFDPKIMRQAARLVDRGAPYIVIVFICFLAVMTWLAPKFKFEYNYLNLEPQHMESIKLIHKIPEWFGIDTNYGMIISKSVDQDRKLAAELRKKSTVSRVDAISDFIPANQAEKLPIIARIHQSIAGIEPAPSVAPGDTAAPMTPEEYDRLIAALTSLRDTIGAPGRGLVGLFYLAELEDAEEGARGLYADLDDLIKTLQEKRGDAAYRNLGRLDREVKQQESEAWGWFEKMSSTRGVTLETLKAKHPELLDRFQGRDGSFLIYAYPSVVIWEENNLKAVARELKEVEPNAMGVAVLFNRILDQIKSDLVRIALIALAVVFVVLLLNYRGLWHTLLTLIPLVAGAVSMVGVMNLIGLKFNIINTGMLPMVIGIGVDYGVYVVHRWMSEGKGLGSIRPTVESTGRAVSLAALTTMIGFASVILAQWRGLSLMGATLTMGIGLCWVSAVVFLPAVLKVIEMVKARRVGGR